MKYHKLSLMGLLIGLCINNAQGETLNDALRMGMARSPSLQYYLSQIASSESSINQARSGWLPNINVSAGTQAVGKESSEGNNKYAVSVEQTIFDFGRTGDKVDNAKFGKGTQIWKAIDDAETISSKVAESYFNIQKGRKLLENNRAQMKEHRRILEVATARADGGMDNQGDVGQVKVRIKGLEASAEDIHAQLMAAIKEYEILVGKAPGTLEETDMTFLDRELEKDLREQVSLSPQIRSMQMEQAAASAQYKYMKKNWLPQLSVSVSQGKTSIYNENDTQVMLNVTSNLFDGGNSYFQAEGAAKQVETARWNVQKTIDDNATSVAQLFQEAIGFRQQAGIFAARSVQSQRVMELYNDQYRVNRRSVIDLLNAAQEYFQTIDNRITSIANHNTTLIRALAKLGKINQAFGVETGIARDDEIESTLNEMPEITSTSPEVNSPVTIAFQERVQNSGPAADSQVASPLPKPGVQESMVSASSPEPDNQTTGSDAADIPDPLALLK